MLPRVAGERLADFVDVLQKRFSIRKKPKGFAWQVSGMIGAKIHANQLNLSGGVQIGVKIGAISVDHLEKMDDDAIEALASSNTIGTLLPTAFLRMPFQPGRKLIDAGCAIALASDYNPGSSPSGNMNL
jgi:imidazolonepropionase